MKRSSVVVLDEFRTTKDIRKDGDLVIAPPRGRTGTLEMLGYIGVGLMTGFCLAFSLWYLFANGVV